MTSQGYFDSYSQERHAVTCQAMALSCYLLSKYLEKLAGLQGGQDREQNGVEGEETR